MDALRRFGDLAIGVLALLWAIGAAAGTPPDGQPDANVWAFGAILAKLCSWQVAGAFAFAALARGRAALLGSTGAAVLLVLGLLPTMACAHAPSMLSAGRCLINDPGLDQVVDPDYASKVKLAKSRLLAGEAEADDLALVVEAAEIAVRLSACVPRDAESQEGATP